MLCLVAIKTAPEPDKIVKLNWLNNLTTQGDGRPSLNACANQHRQEDNLMLDATLDIWHTENCIIAHRNDIILLGRKQVYVIKIEQAPPQTVHSMVSSPYDWLTMKGKFALANCI